MYLVEHTTPLMRQFGLRPGDELIVARATDGGLVLAGVAGGGAGKKVGQRGLFNLLKAAGREVNRPTLTNTGPSPLNPQAPPKRSASAAVLPAGGGGGGGRGGAGKRGRPPPPRRASSAPQPALQMTLAASQLAVAAAAGQRQAQQHAAVAAAEGAREAEEASQRAQQLREQQVQLQRCYGFWDSLSLPPRRDRVFRSLGGDSPPELVDQVKPGGWLLCVSALWLAGWLGGGRAGWLAGSVAALWVHLLCSNGGPAGQALSPDAGPCLRLHRPPRCR